MSKTVLITGAAKGIGAACARAFAEAGYQVAVHYHTSSECAAALQEELKNTKAKVLLVQADITDRQQVAEMFDQIRCELGPVDVLVNNAGISEFSLFTDLTEAQWDHMFDVNCKGAFLCSQEALRDMLDKKDGAIVNISSMWGQVGASCEVHYSASKAALIGLTKALAKELGPSHIRVNAIAPGAIDTDMMAQVEAEATRELIAETPLMRLGTPADIAQLACFLASEKASFITGQVIGSNGGMVIV